MDAVTLHSARLELSIPTNGDVDAIFAACQDPGIQRYTTVPSPYTRVHAEQFVVDVAAQWAADEHLTWAMRRDDELIGMVGLYRLSAKGDGELGYWVARQARGQGYLTEASRTVLDWGFSEDGLALTRIEWHASVGNIASARAARALGFRYEGMRRQALKNSHGRDDGWAAALLSSDDRRPQPWPVLPD
ncbi:GNAT family N-acetyltransferase [Microbacterium sp. P02]|uniref:GNAT family N-acetyltransferase n=1 Tax=unclassified Microbacterium TaxID=2609290 RepID=UPI00367071F1